MDIEKSYKDFLMKKYKRDWYYKNIERLMFNKNTESKINKVILKATTGFYQIMNDAMTKETQRRDNAIHRLVEDNKTQVKYLKKMLNQYRSKYHVLEDEYKKSNYNKCEKERQKLKIELDTLKNVTK